MLPKKELNIYPKTEDNLRAVISFYFDSFEINVSEGLEFLKDKTSMSLNQIEFVLRKLSESYLKVFREKLSGKIKLTNLLSYGFEALTISEKDWKGSKPRVAITKEFYEFVKKTEIDYTYLEKNN